MAPIPKHPSKRQRRNKTPGHAILPAEGTVTPIKGPPLPKRRDEDGELVPWHEMTEAFWTDTWASPMAHEFVKADHHGLFLLADLFDQYWWTRNAQLLPEIRLQRQAFGLTPIDRRRLQWEVERGESAAAKGKRRAEPKKRRRDPAKVLEGGFAS